MRRRHFLAGAATAPVLAGALAASVAVDPHSAWLARLMDLKAKLDKAPEDPVEDDPRLAEVLRLERLICSTTPATAEGALAQLEYAMSDESGFAITGNVWDGLDEQLFRNLRDCLQDMASGRI